MFCHVLPICGHIWSNKSGIWNGIAVIHPYFPAPFAKHFSIVCKIILYILKNDVGLFSEGVKNS